jgi:hypothetical protein
MRVRSALAHTRAYAVLGIVHALSLKIGSFLCELVTVSEARKFLKNDVGATETLRTGGKTDL